MKTLGWETRLIEYLRSVASQPFRPGTLDCGLFFAGGVEAMTGQDIAKPFRGKYRTIEKAQRIAQSLGFADHVEYTASLLTEYASPLMAQRGDGAVILDEQGSPALGIVQGENIYVMTLTGMSLLRLETATRAFAV